MPGRILMLPAALCLIACLTFPVLYFQGRIAPETYKSALSAATFGYFVCAAMLAARVKLRHRRGRIE